MLDLLCALSAAGQEIQAADANDDTTAKLAIVERLTVDNNHIAEARKLVDSGSSELWTQLQTQKIVLADVARAFSAIISLAPEAQALQAATVYASLLITPGCPVRIITIDESSHLCNYWAKLNMLYSESTKFPNVTSN